MSSTAALVTGAPGWLGTRLVQALTHGLPDLPELAPPASRPIRCLVLPESEPAGLAALGELRGPALVEGDLRDPQAVREFVAGAEGATLFHCAGVVHPARSTRELHAVNAEGTRQLLEAAEAAGIRRAIVVSSNSPIGTNPNRQHRFDENSPYHPYMEYGRSKVRMEQAVAEIQSRGRLETVVIRPPWFYGPGQPPRQTLFFTMIRTGRLPIVGDGGNLRSMAYVDNICQGLLLCERIEAAAGRTYWIADRRPYTTNEIVDTIERLLADEFGFEVSGRRLRLPNLVSELAWLADKSLQSLTLYHQKIHVLSEMNKNIACRIDRAEKELGFAPKIDLEEGMRRSIQWCIDQGFKL
jgi:nucleoside-diphosphate-sugar epimerase